MLKNSSGLLLSKCIPASYTRSPLLSILQILVTAFSLYLLLSLCIWFFPHLLTNTSMDPYKELGIILNPEGTLTRLDLLPESPPSPDPSLPIPVLSKDLPINQSNHTWARLYLPRKALDNNPPDLNLPLVVFFHGGGFILHSAASTYFHDFCINMANDIPSVVVSVEYRLAPEHRLPAAYDDAVEALHWIATANDAWLTRHADFTRCYLMGESAGGNIAYHAGLRAAAEIDQIEPVNIRGMVLIQPFFGGTNRTESELTVAEGSNLPLPVTDLMWELSLPVGADRGHEFANPTVNGGAKVLDQIRSLGWRIGVFGCSGDQLVDRQKELVKLLEGKGVIVEGQFCEGGRHGIFVGELSMNNKVFDLLKSFIHANSVMSIS